MRVYQLTLRHLRIAHARQEWARTSPDASLTTMLGYLALVGSKNQAVHSLGVLAVLGEICCLLSAVLVLPAALLVLGEKRVIRTGQQPAP